jgi:serine/threonine protein kinase/TolB-like protein/Flp pilus assembly protein TadD
VKYQLDLRRWAEMRATFDSLIDLDENDRSAQLKLLNTSDPELHAAVDALLRADTEAESRRAAIESSDLRRVPATDPLRLTGVAVSHFHVAECIGAGGMGVVYRAVDTNLGRPVALKLLPPAYSLDASARTRFLREGQSAAALDHANLCAVYEVGISDDGWMFLAMPLYEGETLRAVLAGDGALPLVRALDIAHQIAEGLNAAHTAGIVHRDLKPGNIMLLPDGGVRILDFGLAKAIDQTLSATGARLGTIAYMSPEQIRGGQVDVRSDLWALGVVLYEMLSGRKPFSGDDIGMAHAILGDTPSSLSTQGHGIPIAVEDVVERLLEKDPRRRYQSATQLLEDLARATNLGVQVDERLRRWVRRGRILPFRKPRLAWAAFAALIIGTVGYSARPATLRSVSPGRVAIAVLPFRNLSTDSTRGPFADMLYQELLTQLSGIASLKIIDRASVNRYAEPNRPPLRAIGSELGVANIVEATVQVVSERLRVNVELIDAATGARKWAGEYDRPFDDAAFALQSDIAQQVVASVGAELTKAESRRVTAMPTSSKEAYLYYQQALYYLRTGPFDLRNLQSAEQLLTRALSLDANFALAHAALSDMHRQLYFYRHDHTPARLAHERGEAEIALRLAPDLPAAHRAMALFYGTARNNNRLFLEEIRIAVRGAPNDAAMWESLANAHRRIGNWDSSLAAFTKARELNPRDPFMIFNHGNWTNTKLRRFQETIAWDDTVAKHWPDLLVVPMNKGWNYAAWQGQLDTLRAAMNARPLRTALEKVPAVLVFEYLRVTRQPDTLLRLLKVTDRSWSDRASPRAFSHPFHYIPLSLYAAWAHEMRGDRPAARAAFDSALVVADAAIRKAPDDWALHHARGMALAGLGRRAEAHREVQVLRDGKVYRDDAFFGPTVRLAAAEVLAQCGDADGAVADLERVLTEGAFGNILQVGITVHSLRMDPTWDPIREDPRFKALLARHS